jgi:hypothetical protein
MWKFRAFVTPLTVKFNAEFTATLIFICLTPGTVDVTPYATVCRPAFRVANVLLFHPNAKHCFYSHARTAVNFITLMGENLKSCSSSSPWWNSAQAKFSENTLYACFFSIWTNIFLCTVPLNRANTWNVDPFQCKAAQKLRGTEIKAQRILVS